MKTCPPHAYRPAGKPFKPIVRKIKRARKPTRYDRRRVEIHNVMGPLTQRLFCARCATPASVEIGP